MPDELTDEWCSLPMANWLAILKLGHLVIDGTLVHDLRTRKGRSTSYEEQESTENLGAHHHCVEGRKSSNEGMKSGTF